MTKGKMAGKPTLDWSAQARRRKIRRDALDDEDDDEDGE